MRLRKIGFCLISVGLLAGCSTSQAVNASADKQIASARSVIGTQLIGAVGKTPTDQRKIDDTIAGICGAGVYTKSECTRHGRETQ